MAPDFLGSSGCGTISNMSTGVRRLSEKIFAERIAAGGIEALWKRDLFWGLSMGSLDETSKGPSLKPGRSSGLRRVRREG